MLTLGEARASRKMAAASGNCTSSDAFRDYVNEGTETLMRRGNFWGTVQLINACIYNECITWPRYVGTVLATNFCGRNVPVFNNWYQFVPIGPEGLSKHGFGFSKGKCFGNTNVANDGTVPVFNNVPCGKARYIRAYIQYRADIGKKITIFGIDSNGQTIRSRDGSGWKEGITLTLQNPTTSPYTSTPFTVREITRVIKEVTQGPVRLFQYDADGDTLHDCATYEPSETLPDYRHSRVQGFSRLCCGSNCAGGVKSMQGLVKLQFVKAEADTDLVLISNMDALALAIQYARLTDSQDDAGAERKMLRAVHELNLELRDKFPLEQTTISINPFGTALPVRHGLGRVV